MLSMIEDSISLDFNMPELPSSEEASNTMASLPYGLKGSGDQHIATTKIRICPVDWTSNRNIGRSKTGRIGSFHPWFRGLFVNVLSFLISVIVHLASIVLVVPTSHQHMTAVTIICRHILLTEIT